MHVHLVGGEVNAKINLSSLEVVSGSVPRDLWIEVRSWLVEHQDALIKEWKSWQR